MNKIIYYNQFYFEKHYNYLENQVPGFENFYKLTRTFQISMGPIDRTASITMPFNVIADPIPEFDINFNLSYEECLASRVKELEKIHQETGKRFRLFYSGGIDSTTIMAAFVSYFGMEKTSKILDICCTKESILENPWNWEKNIIPNKFTISSSLSPLNRYDKNFISLNGEGNDQLFAGETYVDIIQSRNGKTTNFTKMTESDIEETLRLRGTRPQDIHYIKEKMDLIIKKCPFNIEYIPIYNFWITLALTWQAVVFRQYVQFSSQNELLEVPTKDYSTAFFDTDLFQLWAIMYHFRNQSMISNSKGYKQEAKNVIIKNLKIPEYQKKQKFMSWPRVHRTNRTAAYITDDWHRHLDMISMTDYINEKNSFL